MKFNETIIPYEGTESIRLYQNLDSVKQLFKAESIQYREEIWQSESETVPNPWNVLVLDGIMTLFFAKNRKLFKIVFWEGYYGKLQNGINVGMKIDEAQKIDPMLLFDEWNEDYESPSGYWVEDSTDDSNIISISVFIKEVLDEEKFDYCNW